MLSLAAPAFAAKGDDWSVQGQVTHLWQYHPAFHSPYRGANSLDPGSRANETFDATLFLGARLWSGAELWADPEVDQGFGISNTFGLAGFPSGEAYKFGSATPYVRVPRLFFRQTINLGGESQTVEAAPNQFDGTRSVNNLVVTIGKFSVVDIFDTNPYAGDPKGDFLNWAIIDSGGFDYAADAWAYTYGMAVEWTQSRITLRGGLFDLSRVPNGKALVRGFGQYELVAEAEERHTLLDSPGSLKLLVFDNRARMGSYQDALQLANITGTVPDTALVRRYAWRPGAALNFEQAITEMLGVFARASLNDGSKETYEFTDINRSIAAGLSLKGADWGRPRDSAGLAAIINGLSRDARDYFAAGGLGTLIGDGRLPHYGSEKIIETYYSVEISGGVALTADYQFIDNPAYNRDRGPVSVLGMRLHSEF
jgi:high affinity Mn2+ porin